MDSNETSNITASSPNTTGVYQEQLGRIVNESGTVTTKSPSTTVRPTTQVESITSDGSDQIGCFDVLFTAIPACYAVLGALAPVLFFHWWLSRSKKGQIKLNKSNPRVLVIVAHPDDECMFFAPTIQGLSRQGCEIHLLCLSKGNFYSQGQLREKELYRSCGILGIARGCCTLLNHSAFPDNPNKQWDASLLSQLLLTHIQNGNIDVVLTFDDYGVSGHANHIAIYKAIEILVNPIGKLVLMPKHVSVYVLESTSIFRKYTGIFDVVLSWLRGSVLYVSDYRQIFGGWHAMKAHWSQLKWFRLLYIFFSRYMYMNTLRKIY